MLHIGRLLLLGAACLAPPLPAFSPAAAGSDCPTLEINCGSAEQCQSKARRRELSAWIAGGDPAVTPTFKWCVSAGEIVSGQDTGAVVIDASGVEEEYVTVVVVVGGFPRGCATTETYLMDLSAGPPAAPTPPGGAASRTASCDESGAR